MTCSSRSGFISPLEQMGVKARVMLGGVIEFSMGDGWEKILEPDSGAYFYRSAEEPLPLVVIAASKNGHCPECGAEPGYHLMTCSHTIVEPIRVSQEVTVENEKSFGQLMRDIPQLGREAWASLAHAPSSANRIHATLFTANAILSRLQAKPSPLPTIRRRRRWSA